MSLSFISSVFSLLLLIEKTTGKKILVHHHLFSDFSVRKAGYRQSVGYLLSNTRLRLDDFYQFYPADKLYDLFTSAQPTSTAEILTKEYVNVILNTKIPKNFFLCSGRKFSSSLHNFYRSK